MLLAQQRLAASSSSGAARSGGSGDDDDDHAVADGGAAAIADLDGALTFDALAETAVEQRACIVVYSNYLDVALFICLIDSKGALAAFEQIDLQKEAASRSITQLVEKTRVSMGVGARGADSGRSIMSPEYHENDKSVARLAPQTTTSAAAAYASAAKPTPAPSPPPPPTPRSAEEVAALVEAISDTATLRRVAAAVRASGFYQSVAREFASVSGCVAAIAASRARAHRSAMARSSGRLA